MNRFMVFVKWYHRIVQQAKKNIRLPKSVAKRAENVKLVKIRSPCKTGYGFWVDTISKGNTLFHGINTYQLRHCILL